MLESNSEDSSNATLTAEVAIANLQSPDLSLRYYAAWWLGKFRVRDPVAVDALIAALEDEADRTELGGYPLRRNAARALGKLGEGRAVPGLIQALDCPDFYVREAAAQSLEMLCDYSAVPRLMQLLEGGVAAAVQIPGQSHLAEPYEAVMEALGTLKASIAIPIIQPFLEHPVTRVQYAAMRAMYQLTQERVYGQHLVQALSGNELKLRRVALIDLGAIGYIPAAEAIAQCAVENSLKIIALKKLLEHQLGLLTRPPVLNDPAIQVMKLIDALL